MGKGIEIFRKKNQREIYSKLSSRLELFYFQGSSEYSDDDDEDSGPNLDWLPDPDKIYGPKGSEDDEGTDDHPESEDDSGDEDAEQPTTGERYCYIYVLRIYYPYIYGHVLIIFGQI